GSQELVGDLEDREHQPALRTPCDVAAALLAPDEFAGLALDALCRAFLVDEATLKNVGLLDVDMLVVGQHRASAVIRPVVRSNSSVLASQPGKRVFCHSMFCGRTRCECVSVAAESFGIMASM